MLSQFGRLPAKKTVKAAMQGPLKELFLGSISILFSTGCEMLGLKVARPRRCWRRQSPRQVGQAKDKEISLWERKKLPEVHVAVQGAGDRRGELFRESALLHYLRSHQEK